MNLVIAFRRYHFFRKVNYRMLIIFFVKLTKYNFYRFIRNIRFNFQKFKKIKMMKN